MGLLIIAVNLCSVLASSLVFNLADGQFSSRADLIDAPGSSLGRGAQVAGLGELCLCHIFTSVCLLRILTHYVTDIYFCNL